MNSYQRMMQVLDHGKPDRVPVKISSWNWAAIQVGYTIKGVLEGVEKHVFAQYYCALDYGYDDVSDLGGIHAESEAMGSKLRIREDALPSVEENAIKDYDEDLKKLKIINPYKDGRLPVILEGVSRLKELCRDKIPVCVYIQAPFRNAAMLRGDSVYRDVLKKEDELHKLMEITKLTQIVYGLALVNAGADVLTISDPTSSGDAISRKHWLKIGFKYSKEVIKELKKTGVKIILHVCGDTSDRLDTFVDLGIDAMSLDEKVDLGYAREVMGDQVCIMGNVSPYNLLRNTPEEIRKESEQCIEKAGQDGNFILAPGCGISEKVPPENIRAMVEVAQRYTY
jgi:uroporphyrinogen decarboxylase